MEDGMSTDTPTETPALEVPTGNDAPLSNEADQATSEPGSQQDDSMGASNGAPAPDHDGLEMVGSYTLPEAPAPTEARSLAGELMFPDIAEASFGPLPAE